MVRQLINDDCFNHLSTITADVVFTSPPYNRKKNDKYQSYEDTLDDYFLFLKRIVDESNYTKYLFLNVQATYYNKTEVYRFIGEYASKIQQIIVWEKSNPMPTDGLNITNAYEFFIVLGESPLKSNYTYTKNVPTTAVNSSTTAKIHKAVMKQEVADWFIVNFTSKGDTVLDPFMGLGTTGISCVKYGRDFIGIEQSKQYYDIACQKLEETSEYVSPQIDLGLIEEQNLFTLE